MKKMFLVLVCFISFFLVNVNARIFNVSNDLELSDVTTKNFTTKLSHLSTDSIYKICTFDYCDYMRDESMEESLAIFTDNYLKTFDDEELKANLYVKGIKITKIILDPK